MQVTSPRFKRKSKENLANSRLQASLSKIKVKFVPGRAAALDDMGNFDAIREAAKSIRDYALNNLPALLERFEQEAIARGTTVHWAETAADANRIVTEIARQHDVQTIVKSKSMVTEECALNEALEAAGLAVIETDLGEYILQLAKEPPSHIVAPVIHKSKDEISDLFESVHQMPRKEGIAELCREAREQLRPKFLAADMGISGANFIVAETGSAMIFTNEGNGRLTTTLPRVHVAITGIEKVVPTLNDVTTLARLLPRSATGQTITNYVSVMSGIRDEGASDGPEHSHIILVDNGRSQLLGTNRQAMLRCIRCGACMNHCPVYQAVGGHAYGWVYPGPMGAVLTPTYVGLEQTLDLPQATTACGKCSEVCPVKIPLSELHRDLRIEQVERGLRPWKERMALALWGFSARHPRLYALGSRVAVRLLKTLANEERMIESLPGAGGWTTGRDLPAPQGRTFREQYRQRRTTP